MLKRTIDILASVLGLVLLSPLLLLLALWIKADSAGPVFFRQKRIGYNRLPFFVFKFRTMVARSPEEIDQNEEKVVSTGEDKRITFSGKIMRALSLDELPQLINVLIGDMSLVGPRPVIPEQLQVVPAKYQDRFNVRPGITGLAQVKGRRSLSWEEQLIYDNKYAREFSVWMDIRIIFQTVYVVIARKGIYGDESKNWRAYLDSWGK